MIFDFLFKKPETEEQLVIRWSDILILKSNYKGEIDIMSFYPVDGVLEDPTQENISRWRNDKARKIRDSVIAKLGNINGQLDIITKELTKYLEKVKAHLLNEGYIYEPDPTKTGWLLNDTGKQVKLFGGHDKYRRHKRRELLAIKKDQSAKIYWWWRKILEWLIAAALGFLLRYLIEPKQALSKDESSKITNAPSIPAKQNEKDTTFK